MRVWLLDRWRRVRRSLRRRGPDQVEADQVRARDRGDTTPGPGAGPPATPGVPGAHRRVSGARPVVPRADPDQPGAPGARPGPPGNSANPASTASPGHVHAGRPRGTGGRARPAAPLGDGQGGDAGGAQGRRGQAGPGRGRADRRAAAARPPWYEIAQSNRTAVGRRHCGHLEPLVHREWAEDVIPAPEVVRAIDRLAELPQLIKSKLAAGLDAIYVGMGGVPNLDDMDGCTGPAAVGAGDLGRVRGRLRRAQDHRRLPAVAVAGRHVPRDRARAG